MGETVGESVWHVRYGVIIVGEIFEKTRSTKQRG